MKIKQFLIILIILFPVISVQSQDITYPDLNNINVYMIPEGNLIPISNISSSDYSLFIITEQNNIKYYIDVIKDLYPYINHTQLSINWIVKGVYDSPLTFKNIKSKYEMTWNFGVTEYWDCFNEYMGLTGIFVILYDSINKEIIHTKNQFNEDDKTEILVLMNQLEITFISLPEELSESIYKEVKNPNKTNIGLFGILSIISLIIWRKRIE